ncbi:MAG: hypothetical protein GC155_11630 [Alphaproteobacteria bacterium]|nr:hypothetical protein [Alphaproteobacteria bacterium]
MAADGLMYEAGDILSLADADYRIVSVSDAAVVQFEACRATNRLTELIPAAPVMPRPASSPVEPDIVVLDGPPIPGEEDDLRPLAFAWSDPWTAPVNMSAGADAIQQSLRARIDRPCTIGRLTSAPYPHVSGRWQEASVRVSVPGEGPSSRDDGAVLNGANAMMVETTAGWEMIQFAEAELVDVETYKLTRLLRGQQGSEPEMALGASVDARVAFLTGAERRLDVADWESGLALQWRTWRRTPEESDAWSSEIICLGAAARMWSPAHLRADRADGGLSLSWIRRARKGGDAWIAGEPPMEVAEGYRIRVSNGGEAMRQWEIDSTGASYPTDATSSDFPDGGVALIEAAQLGADREPGAWASASVTISP